MGDAGAPTGDLTDVNRSHQPAELRAHVKGSHDRVYVGAQFTIVQRRELKTGTLAAMLRQLNIDRREF